MEGFKYYHFEPNFGAAVFFALAFGVPSILHIRLIAIHRAFYFIPFLIGCLRKSYYTHHSHCFGTS